MSQIGACLAGGEVVGDDRGDVLTPFAILGLGGLPAAEFGQLLGWGKADEGLDVADRQFAASVRLGDLGMSGTLEALEAFLAGGVDGDIHSASKSEISSQVILDCAAAPDDHLALGRNAGGLLLGMNMETGNRWVEIDFGQALDGF